MKYARLIFSPTGGTQKAAELITSEWGGEIETIDLCDPKAPFSEYSFQAENLVLIAVPSYGGRVPALAAARLARVHGNGAGCVLLCVYGNRAYDDTLAEMKGLAEGCGFRVLAAVSAVAEHSIAHEYAAGRPDSRDEEELRGFSRKILEKFSRGDASAPEVPGNLPDKKAGGIGLVPKADKSCNGCGLCAESCPAQAISRDNVRTGDPKKCISCMRCVVRCPRSARKASRVMVSAAALALRKACSVRKGNELFL